MHLRPGLKIVLIVDGPLEELLHDPEGVLGPDVRDGIAALICGPEEGVGRPGRPLRVVNSRERLQGVAEDVKAESD